MRIKTVDGETFTFAWEQWTPKDIATLTFIRTQGNVLLILKKRGLGKGLYNAPGGRLEPGETPMETAVRETEEEVGITPQGLHEAGRLDFCFVDGYSLQCHVFTASDYTGALTETDEATPFWCKETEIPYGNMWSDDRLWIPLMLKGVPFHAQFIFDRDVMLWHTLSILPIC